MFRELLRLLIITVFMTSTTFFIGAYLIPWVIRINNIMVWIENKIDEEWKSGVKGEK